MRASPGCIGLGKTHNRAIRHIIAAAVAHGIGLYEKFPGDPLGLDPQIAGIRSNLAHDPQLRRIGDGRADFCGTLFGGRR